MAKAKNIKYAPALLLIVLLLCGISIAGPTYSFGRMATESESTGLSQPGATPWSLGTSLENALSIYRDMEEEDSSDVDVFDDLSAVTTLSSQASDSSSSASASTQGKSLVNASVTNSAQSSNGNKWGYWTRSRNGTGSTPGGDTGGPNGGYSDPRFPDSQGDGPIDPGTIDPADTSSAVVPAPAAISLGCLGLMLVGWLRNRKTF